MFCYAQMLEVDKHIVLYPFVQGAEVRGTVTERIRTAGNDGSVSR